MKKGIFVGITVVLLIMLGVMLNFIIRNGENSNVDIILNNSDTARNNVQGDTLPDENGNAPLEDDNLELTGDEYKPENGVDVNGNEVSAISEDGKPMVVLYWNTKEENSMEAVKMLQKYYADYQEKVTFMLIYAMDNDGEDKTPAEDFIAENGIEIPVMYKVVLDPASTANDINNIPTFLVVNKHGEKINSMMDHITEDVIEANLDIIAENF